MKQTPKGIKTRNQRTTPTIVINGTKNKIIKNKNKYLKRIKNKKIQNNKKTKPLNSSSKKRTNRCRYCNFKR